jgi:hypothetical protein
LNLSLPFGIEGERAQLGMARAIKCGMARLTYGETMNFADKLSQMVRTSLKNGHVLFIALAVLSSCTPKKIPGTEIDDTTETRAVLDVMQDFRNAVETRNAKTIKAMAHKDFRDDGGSANPDDDMDYATMEAVLAERFKKVNEFKLDVTVRRVEFSDDGEAVRVTYSYQMSFKMPNYSARTQSENDIKQMTLKRVGEKSWKIVSGI